MGSNSGKEKDWELKMGRELRTLIYCRRKRGKKVALSLFMPPSICRDFISVGGMGGNHNFDYRHWSDGSSRTARGFWVAAVAGLCLSTGSGPWRPWVGVARCSASVVVHGAEAPRLICSVWQKLICLIACAGY